MQRIEASIAGRIIPLKVTPEEENIIREAIDQVNLKIQQLQQEYTQKDIQDCVLMTLLTYAVDYHKAQSRILDEKSVQTLSNINDQLKVLESQTS